MTIQKKKKRIATMASKDLIEMTSDAEHSEFHKNIYLAAVKVNAHGHMEEE